MCGRSSWALAPSSTFFVRLQSSSGHLLCSSSDLRMNHLFFSTLVMFTLLFRIYSEGDSSKKGPKATVNVWFDIAIGDAPPESGIRALYEDSSENSWQLRRAAKVNKHLSVTRTASSTRSSRTSWFREETSTRETSLEDSVSTAADSPMRTSS